jgi:hypothetical protein
MARRENKKKGVLFMNDAKLEKKLSPINVWALAFGCIIGFGSFMLPGNTFFEICGPNGNNHRAADCRGGHDPDRV